MYVRCIKSNRTEDPGPPENPINRSPVGLRAVLRGPSGFALIYGSRERRNLKLMNGKKQSLSDKRVSAHKKSVEY